MSNGTHTRGGHSATAARVREVRVQRLYDRNWWPAATGIPFAAMAALLLLSLGSGLGALIAWFVSKLIGAGLRMGLTWRYEHRRSSASTEIWERRYVVALVVDGLSWSAFGVLCAAPPQTLQTFIAAGTLLGIATVGIGALSSHFQANVAFTTSMLVPASVFMALQGDTAGLYAGPSLLLMLALVLANGRRASAEDLELLQLRFEIGEVARERSEALELARRHSAAKNQFLATVSHEMRTPLHGILGTLRLLREGLGTRATREDLYRLGLLEHSGDHLLGVINDVLDFSRIEAGALAVREVPFDLARTLDEAVQLLGATAAEHGLVLRGELGLPRPAWTLGDGDRVRQILLNLIGNGVKFTARGEVAVLSEVVGDRVLVRVRDTGPGIAPDQQALVFEAFQQADGTFSRKFQGTGLGLTISREFARALGGDLRCESTIGVGSTFTLELPWKPVPAPVEVAPAARARLPRLSGRVLLVEDDEVNVLVARAALVQLGVTVVVAGDGVAGLAAWGASPFDLVLMDCHLPGLDGFEAARRIRQQEQALGRPRKPILAVTAASSDDQRERCRAAGMDEMVAKPFAPADLGAALARWLPLAPPALADVFADRAAALERLDGDTALYNDLLRAFARRQRGSGEDLRQALSEGRRDDARRLAHSLSGLGATLGAPRLSANARALEHALGEGVESLAPLLDAAEDDLQIVLAAIDGELAAA